MYEILVSLVLIVKFQCASPFLEPILQCAVEMVNVLVPISASATVVSLDQIVPFL